MKEFIIFQRIHGKDTADCEYEDGEGNPYKQIPLRELANRIFLSKKCDGVFKIDVRYEDGMAAILGALGEKPLLAKAKKPPAAPLLAKEGT